MSNLPHGINNTVTIVYPIYLGVAFVSYTFLFHRTLLETMLSITTEPNMFFLIYNIVKKKTSINDKRRFADPKPHH